MFPKDTVWLFGVHVLDLEKTGYIGPHIDSVKVIVTNNTYISNNAVSVFRQHFIWPLFIVYLRHDFKERKNRHNCRFAIKTTHIIHHEVRKAIITNWKLVFLRFYFLGATSDSITVTRSTAELDNL